jgi:hypothetical protein
MIGKAKGMIQELEALLPVSSNSNFRERLVTHMEYLESSTELGSAESGFLVKAYALLSVYESYFGVKDLVEKSEEE